MDILIFLTYHANLVRRRLEKSFWVVLQKKSKRIKKKNYNELEKNYNGLEKHYRSFKYSMCDQYLKKDAPLAVDASTTLASSGRASSQHSLFINIPTETKKLYPI